MWDEFGWFLLLFVGENPKLHSLNVVFVAPSISRFLFCTSKRAVLLRNFCLEHTLWDFLAWNCIRACPPVIASQIPFGSVGAPKTCSVSGNEMDTLGQLPEHEASEVIWGWGEVGENIWKYTIWILGHVSYIYMGPESNIKCFDLNWLFVFDLKISTYSCACWMYSIVHAMYIYIYTLLYIKKTTYFVISLITVLILESLQKCQWDRYLMALIDFPKH